MAKTAKVVIAFAFLLAATAYTLLFNSRRSPVQPPLCINNLLQLKSAKAQWALERHKTTNDIPTWDDLREYLKPVALKCPNGGSYMIGRVDELPTCSIPKDAERWRTTVRTLEN